MSTFKKNPTIEELQKEVELLQSQVITTNSKLNAAIKKPDNHPAAIELASVKSKWWYRFFTWMGL